MATTAPTRKQVSLCIGKAGLPVGSLVHVRQGQRENTAPDAWGRRVIARDHAKRRKANPALSALTELDYLVAVDDFSRVGALRLRDPAGAWHHEVALDRRNTAPLIELERVFQASRAVELGQATAEDLRYLQGKGTSLGGPGDAVPVAVIRRFDRDGSDGRIPYQSAASLLQASREQDHSYTEIADAIRTHGHAPTQDLQQLWPRPSTSTLSPTKTANPRPGCPNWTGRSPKCRCCWPAPQTSHWTRRRPWPFWPRCTPTCRTGGKWPSARGWGFDRWSWTTLHRPSSMRRRTQPLPCSGTHAVAEAAKTKTPSRRG